MRKLLVGWLAALAACVVATTAQSPVALKDLTVPADRLATGCALAPKDSERLEGGKVRGGFWMGLPITTNPWIGTDARVIANVREYLGPRYPVPDGPPLTLAELSAFRLRLAEGVEEGYVAIYKQDDSSPELLRVFGLRFKDAQTASREAEKMRSTRNTTRAVHVVTGPIVAVLHGDGGACFKVLAAHLTALAR